jgi:zinc transporter ZupT
MQPLFLSWIAVPLAGLTVISTIAGGLFALRLRGRLQDAIALSGGIVVAVAIFDLIPEALDAVGNADRVAGLIGAGFLLFFVAHRFLVLHHRDEPEQALAHRRVGRMSAAALGLHSFADGLAIGLAFGLNAETGVLVLLAVVSHDFADGINAVTFIVRQGGSRESAIRWLSLVALAPLLGALVGTAVDISEYALGHLLALYAGIFLYIGASDLLPEAHQHSSVRRMVVTIAGFAGVFAVARAFGEA